MGCSLALREVDLELEEAICCSRCRNASVEEYSTIVRAVLGVVGLEDLDQAMDKPAKII